MGDEETCFVDNRNLNLFYLLSDLAYCVRIHEPQRFSKEVPVPVHPPTAVGYSGGDHSVDANGWCEGGWSDMELSTWPYSCGINVTVGGHSEWRYPLANVCTVA